jgi:glycosyltransferase involved in cell wall biosynthesis
MAECQMDFYRQIVRAPQVTVLTTVYNGEKYLHDCMRSILGQQFTDFEFVIIDDGSTDATAEIVKSYNDPRIVFIQANRMGRTKVLNWGLSLARGKYVAILDADDVSSPDRLSSQHGMMAANDELDIVGSFCSLIDENGKLVDRAFLQTDSLYGLWRLQFQCNIYASSVMLKKSAAVEAGMFREGMLVAHDYSLFLAMAKPSNTHMIPRFLCEYRMFSETQLTNKHYGNMIKEAVQVSNEALRACDPTLTDEECSAMRPVYWLLERTTVTPTGIRAIARTFEGFCRKYGINQEARVRLAGRVAGDVLRAIVRNCDCSILDRVSLAAAQVKDRPVAIPNFFLTELKRVVTRLFKRTRFNGRMLRLVYR